MSSLSLERSDLFTELSPQSHTRFPEDEKNLSAVQKNDFLRTTAEEKREEVLLKNLPQARLSQLLKKPVVCRDGALLPLGGVTFSLSSGSIRHLIVRLSVGGQEASEVYFSFPDAKISAWRISPASQRPRSPKGTLRLVLDKPVYSESGEYYGKLTDALVKYGKISLLYADGKPFSFRRLLAAGDAVILQKTQPYPLGERVPEDIYPKSLGETRVRFQGQVTRSTLQYFVRSGGLIRLTTALSLFSPPNP